MTDSGHLFGPLATRASTSLLLFGRRGRHLVNRLVRTRATTNAGPNNNPKRHTHRRAPNSRRITTGGPNHFHLTRCLRPSLFVGVTRNRRLHLTFFKRQAPFVRRRHRHFTTTTRSQLRFTTGRHRRTLTSIIKLNRDNLRRHDIMTGNFFRRHTRSFILTLRIVGGTPQLGPRHTDRVTRNNTFVTFVARRIDHRLRRFTTDTIQINRSTIISRFTRRHRNFLLIRPFSPAISRSGTPLTTGATKLHKRFGLTEAAGRTLKGGVFRAFAGRTLT